MERQNEKQNGCHKEWPHRLRTVKDVLTSSVKHGVGDGPGKSFFGFGHKDSTWNMEL